MIEKLLNNNYFGYIVGTIVTVIAYLLVGLFGKTANIWAISGLIGVLVNTIGYGFCYYKFDKAPNIQVLYSGITGSILTALLLLI
jgi:hypothetical protein